jgi:protoheme IX farnesyltransferase
MEKVTSFEVEHDGVSRVRDYFSLLKPRVMSLVVLSGFTGLVLAPGNIHPFIAFVAILSIAVGAGASGAINMWYDRDIDAIMLRTRNRPLVTGRISPSEALAFGIWMSFFSVLVMLVCVNTISAVLLLFTILFYIVVYTMWLKRTTAQNIVIGGASGAFPPMIGWAAVTNNISIESLSLFLIIFLWTPPHFWALALYKADDYRRCNVPMMPIVAGDLYTKKLIIFYTTLTVLSSFLPFYFNMVGYFYLFISIMLGIIFIYNSLALLIDKKNELAPKLFRFSIIYLFAILFAMIISKIL